MTDDQRSMELEDVGDRRLFGSISRWKTEMKVIHHRQLAAHSLGYNRGWFDVFWRSGSGNME